MSTTTNGYEIGTLRTFVTRAGGIVRHLYRDCRHLQDAGDVEERFERDVYPGYLCRTCRVRHRREVRAAAAVRARG